jgi:ATP-dependent exoDNAse (exonuclease V) beta subunit
MSERRLKEYPFVLSTHEGIESGRPDLVFTEDDALVILDYKTDNVASGAEAEEKMKSSYREQGRRYAEGMEKITGLRVKETVFIFLKPDPPIEAIV